MSTRFRCEASWALEVLGLLLRRHPFDVEFARPLRVDVTELVVEGEGLVAI